MRGGRRGSIQRKGQGMCGMEGGVVMGKSKGQGMLKKGQGMCKWEVGGKKDKKVHGMLGKKGEC